MATEEQLWAALVKADEAATTCQEVLESSTAQDNVIYAYGAGVGTVLVLILAWHVFLVMVRGVSRAVRGDSASKGAKA